MRYAIVNRTLILRDSLFKEGDYERLLEIAVQKVPKMDVYFDAIFYQEDGDSLRMESNSSDRGIMLGSLFDVFLALECLGSFFLTEDKEWLPTSVFKASFSPRRSSPESDEQFGKFSSF